MIFRIIQNKTQERKWNDFLIHNGGSFLQSLEWTVFQESLNHKSWKCQLINNKNNEILLQALIIKYKSPRGLDYFYCPRGPTINSKFKNQKQASYSIIQNFVEKFLGEIKDSAERKKAVSIIIDPEWLVEEEIVKTLKKIGFKKNPIEKRGLLPIDLSPIRTLFLDLTKSEQELLFGMHPKTRYNIRLAQKRGVQIKIANSDFQNYLEDCYKLLQQTTKRQKFPLRPKVYYQNMLEILKGGESFNISAVMGNLKPENKVVAKLFLAKYQKKIIAANYIIFFGNRATFRHGSSDYNYRSLMAPHLLQWRQILEAKRRSCTEYDFWGIDEKMVSGLTRFKKSFVCLSESSTQTIISRTGKKLEYIGPWTFRS